MGGGADVLAAVGHVAVVIGAVEALAVPTVREVHVQLEERLDPRREDLRDEWAGGALPDQHLELLWDNRAAGRRRARPGEPDAGAAAAGPVDDVRALRVVCRRVAGDHLQADWKRVHLVVAAQVVIELPLWRPDLLAVLEERRHPVGRLVGLWLAGRAPGPQARGGRARVRRLVAEEGVGVRAAGLPRIDDRVVISGVAEAAVCVEVVAMELGRRRSGRGTRAEQ